MASSASPPPSSATPVVRTRSAHNRVLQIDTERANREREVRQLRPAELPEGPYLTHVVRHHGQLTLIPPQNAGRMRKPKKRRPTPGDRTDLLDDEPRFTTAVPPSTSKRLHSSPPKRAPERERDRDRDRDRDRVQAQAPPRPRKQMPPPVDTSTGDNVYQVQEYPIPDYPPPSFQEAISSAAIIPASPIPASPDFSSAVSANPIVPAPSRRSPIPPSPQPSTQPQPVSPVSVSTHDNDSSGSDSHSSSAELVSLDPHDAWEAARTAGLALPQRVDREYERLRAEESARHAQVAATRAQLTQVLPPTSCASTNAALPPSARERLCSHCGSFRPPHGEDQTSDNEGCDDARSAHHSLSALHHGKKKLGSRSRSPDAESVSAPPSPASPTAHHSPWASSVTLLLSPILPSHKNNMHLPNVLKHKESSGLRRLFGRGKDKGRADVTLNERPRPASAIYDWEVVDRLSVDLTEGEGVGVPPSNEHPAMPTLDRSRTPSTPILRQNSANPIEKAKGRERPAPSPLAFLNRPVRGPNTPISPILTSPSRSRLALEEQAPTPHRATPAEQFPPEKPKKRQPQPQPTHKASSRTLRAIPSVIWKPGRQGTSAEVPPVPPVPVTPVSPSAAGAPSVVVFPPCSSDSPSLMGAIRADWEMSDSIRDRSPISPRTPLLSSASPSPLRGRTPEPAPSPLSASAYPSPSPSPKTSLDEPRRLLSPPTPHALLVEKAASLNARSVNASPSTPTTPTGQHYPGRPLPLPPVIDGDALPTPVGSPIAPRNRLVSDAPTVTSVSRAVHVVPAVQAMLATPGPEQVMERQERQEFSDLTDLDVLAARAMTEDEGDGRNYDDYLLISEVVGPAAGQSSRHQASSSRSASPFVGRIEAQRRRTLKDGTIKVKLLLFGAPVDKCGICLNQFKDGQTAAIGPTCQHAFHERCLKRWLARSGTCPNCRVALRLSLSPFDSDITGRVR